MIARRRVLHGAKDLAVLEIGVDGIAGGSSYDRVCPLAVMGVGYRRL